MQQLFVITVGVSLYHDKGRTSRQIDDSTAAFLTIKCTIEQSSVFYQSTDGISREDRYYIY